MDHSSKYDETFSLSQQLTRESRRHRVLPSRLSDYELDLAIPQMLNTRKGSIVLPVSKVEGNIPNIPQDYDTDDEIELNIFKGDNKPNVKTVDRPNRYVSTGNRSLDHIEIFKECHLPTVEDKDNSLDKEQKDDSIEKSLPTIRWV